MKNKVFFYLGILATLIILMSTIIFANDDKDNTNGLIVTINTDKESYKNGDVINFDVIIENTSTYTYSNLYYEISMPEGVTFPESTKTINKLNVSGNFLKPFSFKTNELSGFDSSGISDTNVTDTDDSSDNQDTTKDSKLPLIIITIAVILGALLVVILLIKRKKKGTTISSILIILLLYSLGFSSISADASLPELENFSMTTVKTISIEGVDKDITVIIRSGNPQNSETESSYSTSDIGIHDPSVFYDPVSGEYYSYGSHIIAGNSDDLISWTYVAQSVSGYGTANELFSHHYLEEFSEIYAWLGSGVKEGIWALDVTYSEAAAKAGNDPYFMYVTVTDATRDCICLATAAKPEGPYTYQGPIVYSDFRASEVKSGQVNLLDVLGKDSIDDLSSEEYNYYITNNTTDYRSKFPQCIDAAPYYDGEGNMYMAYGSFSSTGALHVLKLDPLTGLRAKDNYSYKPAELQDPYYGRQITTKRGEGPYILTVKSDLSSTGYYYFLFWSQGTLSSTGGYNMRMLRSEYPDRGFVDYAGNSAMNSSIVGVRIMDNFWFTTMPYSSTANGGNSAIVTNDGKMFLHYHSKSAHANAYGENGFIIKSNQMFLNEDGWLVTTPFKYYGETMSVLNKEDIVGDYEFIYHTLVSNRHPSDFNLNFVSSEFIRLNEDGSVTGKYEGTWSINGNYFTININDKEYKGVVLEQYDESNNRVKTVVFTATGTDNRCVWGSKIYYTDEERVKIDSNNLSVQNSADEDFTLDIVGRLNSKITWTSDNSAIVIDGATANVVRQDSEQTVTLTANITFGNGSITRTFTVTVPAEKLNIPSVISSSNISLPATTEAGKKITWTSSNPNVINVVTGVVNVPKNSSEVVILTGEVEGSERIITHNITVMPIPSKVVYSENYDTLADISKLWSSTNAQDSLTLQAANGGKYVQFAPGSANSRGAISTFPSDAQVDNIYLLEFDLALTAGNDQTTEFAVSTSNMKYIGVINDGIASGYLFKLSSTNSTTWAINDADTFTLDKGQWIHISALVDSSTSSVAITISSSDGNQIYTGTVTANDIGALSGFYIRGGRYESITCIDNITIKK